MPREANYSLFPGGDGSPESPGPPSPPTATSEHERRVAWGRKWGPMVAEAVRKAIQESE